MGAGSRVMATSLPGLARDFRRAAIRGCPTSRQSGMEASAHCQKARAGWKAHPARRGGLQDAARCRLV